MNTDHAKAIKGMGIANIVLAALGILGVLCVWAMLGVSGAAISGSGYDYFYTDSGYYMTVDDINAILGVLGVLIFFVFVGCVLILIAGIMAVRGANKPEKLKGVMIWNIVGAVASFCSGTWISLVLCIITAVFANKDKKLYEQAMPVYGAAPVAPAMSGAPVQPQQPYVAPVVPVAPAQPASDPAPVTPTEPVAAAAVTETAAVEAAVPAEPVAAVEETVAAAEPAVMVPDNYIEDATTDVTVIEEPADKPEA